MRKITAEEMELVRSLAQARIDALQRPTGYRIAAQIGMDKDVVGRILNTLMRSGKLPDFKDLPLERQGGCAMATNQEVAHNINRERKHRQAGAVPMHGNRKVKPPARGETATPRSLKEQTRALRREWWKHWCSLMGSKHVGYGLSFKKGGA